MPPRHLTSTAAKTLALAACLLATGCAYRATTDAERSASLAPHRRLRVGESHIADHIMRRSAFLIAGNQLETRPDRGSARYDRLDFRVKSGDPGSLRCGTATAVDRRGYFITAAHSLVEGDPFLAFHSGGKVQLERARVVWKGKYRRGEADMAVLAVDRPLESVFAWAPAPPPGSPVLAAGLNTDRKANFHLVCLAGELKKTIPRNRTAPGTTIIYHRTPVHRGDSGGPLVDVEGRLLGINIEIRPENWLLLGATGFISLAERPNLGWLRSVIDADFAARRASRDG